MTANRNFDTGQLYGFGVTAHGTAKSKRQRSTRLLSLVAVVLCAALLVVFATAIPVDHAIAAHMIGGPSAN